MVADWRFWRQADDGAGPRAEVAGLIVIASAMAVAILAGGPVEAGAGLHWTLGDVLAGVGLILLAPRARPVDNEAEPASADDIHLADVALDAHCREVR